MFRHSYVTAFHTITNITKKNTVLCHHEEKNRNKLKFFSKKFETCLETCQNTRHFTFNL